MSKPDDNAKPTKSARPQKAGFKPGMIILAIMLFWAAAHQPAQISLTGCLAWLLGALTAGLLAKAGFAVGIPMLKFIIRVGMKPTRETRSAPPKTP